MILHGDCIEVMRGLDANSVDTCVTDPPYGLQFMGKEWDSSGIAFQVDTWKEVYRVLKPGAILLAFGGTRTYHRMVCAIEDAGFEIRDQIDWIYGSGFPKSLDIGKAIDKQAGNEREVIGKELVDIGMQSGNMHAGRKSEIVERNITKGDSGWDGWGTALKPAHEPIVVAMKPLDGTFAENALKWGVAGLWIDGGRVEYAEQEPDNRIGTDFVSNGGDASANANDNQVPNKYYVQMYKSQGRFPANIIHDGSDDVVAGFPNDAQRFFYCAKASRAERNAGLEGMEERNLAGHNKWTDCDYRKGNGEVTANPQSNHHPTVKPIELMRYLVRLTKTPTGGVVLDPFCGSGTTGIACVLEGRDFIGIEREAEYIEIAEKRIEHYRLPMLEEVDIA